MGRWNLEAGRKLRLSLLEDGTPEVAKVAFPYFAGIEHEHFNHQPLQGPHADVLVRTVPVQRVKLAEGREAIVATVFDLQAANYGVARGLRDEAAAKSFDDGDTPYTPA